MSTKHSHTKENAEEELAEDGNRLKAAFENTKELVAKVRDKAVAGAKATDKAVQEHPYKAIAIAAGIGLLFGFIVARRHAAKKSADQD